MVRSSGIDRVGIAVRDVVAACRIKQLDASIRMYNDQQLSFTDAMIVTLCETRGIDTVCSFDTDFDGIVDRIDS